MAWADQIALHRSAITERATITALAWSFLFLLCASLVFVSQDVDAAHNIYFDSRRVLLAAASVAMFGSCVPLLASARNPLGFSTSFYLLTITAGYLWLSYFRSSTTRSERGFQPWSRGRRSPRQRSWSQSPP